MNCPSCGAEIKEGSKKCQYCGKGITIKMQKEREMVNKQGCPKCSSTNTSFSREKHGEIKSKKSNKAIIKTVGLCKDCGYTWVTDESYSSSTHSIWIWVIGWIFMFPIPLMILLKRKKNMKPLLKWGIIVLAWLFYFAFLQFSSENSENRRAATNNSNQDEIQASSNTTTADDLEAYVDSIVNEFNKSASSKMGFIEEFVPADKSSMHYRTEFRLNAYNDAVGKSYTYSDKTVDVVAIENFVTTYGIRFYAVGISLDQCNEMISILSSKIDSEVTDLEVKEAIDYINEKKEANGYIYGRYMKIELSSSDENGFNLMITNY